MFKLVSLRASGFKRLEIKEKLYFPEGRLLVHGRNESGKSTLMEAIHYALYGMPLRPSKNAGNEDIICYGRDRAIVELEFSIDDSQYLVRRELYKNKGNQHFLNKRDQDGTLSRITRGARSVNDELNEILHGIDSDALLNSCLVEQKELGKLEDANKQERIRAMSSLLSLEAFVDARSTVRKESSELEKTHLQTLIRLREAEEAKKTYEDAQKKLESAQRRLTEIEQEKKEVEEKLGKVEARLETAEQLARLFGQLREAESALENIMVRLEECQRQYTEASEAKERIIEIEEKITQYTPVKNAVDRAEKISGLFIKLTTLRNEAARLEAELDSTRERLEESKESDELIQRLEEQETQATSKRERAKTMRTLGIVGAVIGLWILLYTVVSSLRVGEALGVIVLAAGGVLFITNEPTKFKALINQARAQRDDMLGERARILDYRENITRLESELLESKENQTNTEVTITQELNQLPDSPREYKASVILTDPETISRLRQEIREDNETLTGFITEKETRQKKAESLESLNSTLEKYQKEREEQEAEAKKLDSVIKETEQESEIPREQVDETTRGLRRDKEEYLQTTATLLQQEQERNNDIMESRKIIEENEELKEQYPVLAEESKREAFRIEAMTRAVKLLELTRDNIVAGVKQNVEKNMMQFLPTLTDNRYNMARIDEANYRIEVYDREAKTWRGKGVFSGATQDQFSLALRLAFAISTIPSSRGARPGFIFLDEPLSGFDSQRRGGFMQLLREDLSKHFAQIIVISHLEALADEFQNSLHLESGKIL